MTRYHDEAPEIMIQHRSLSEVLAFVIVRGDVRGHDHNRDTLTDLPTFVRRTEDLRQRRVA